MGRLTTHALDTAAGKPAAGLALRLDRVEATGHRTTLVETHTNKDGRTDRPLLDEGEFRTGTYELVFQVADYFRASATTRSEPPFLDVVTLRFTVARTDEHYHVPLLVSPWSYSTYRGS